MQSPFFRGNRANSKWSRFSRAVFLFLIPPAALGQAPALIDSLAPGLIHFRYLTAAPHSINVLSVDLRESSLLVESYRPRGLVKTSQQALENDRTGHSVLAAVNADFFSFETGMPVGNQVVNGVVAKGTKSSRSHFAMAKGKPFIEQLSFSGSILWKNKAFTVDGVNGRRAAGTLMLYNSYWGFPIGDSSAWRMSIDMVGDGGPQDTLQAVVMSTGKDVVSGISPVIAGDSSLFGKDFPKKGDSLSIVVRFSGVPGSYAQIVGGGGRILENGALVGDRNIGQENIAPKFLHDRHPRTFIGFDRDTTVLFLCTVDGRQSASIGMNFTEMGEFLLSIGAWNAVNLDGGGSTTMVVRQEVVNSPSDSSGERPVANSLQVVVTEQAKNR